MNTYEGFFINLRDSRERAETLSRHLAEHGLVGRYQRVDAVDGDTVTAYHATKLKAGALGCWLSHENIIKSHRSGARHIHVIEDDIILAADTDKIFDGLLRDADQKLEWDIIFTETIVPPDLSIFTVFRKRMDMFREGKGISLISLAKYPFAGTSSYFLNRESIGRLGDLIEGQWTLGIPLDLFLRKLVHEGQLRAFVTLPFLTTLGPHSAVSTIGGRAKQSRLVIETYSRAFFKDTDLILLKADISAFTHGTTNTPLTSIYLDTLAFVLSDQYVNF